MESDLLTACPLFLAAALSRITEISPVIVLIVGLFVIVTIPLGFILSLLFFLQTKKKRWLVGLSMTAILAVFLLVAAGVGVMSAFNQSRKAAEAQLIVAEERVNVDQSGISLILPTHWGNMPELHEDAVVTAGNVIREEYMIILTDLKSDFAGDLESFSELTTESIISALENVQLHSTVRNPINGFPSVKREFSGTINKIQIEYQHTSIDAGDYYHQILQWTLRSKKDRAFPVYNGVLGSIELKE